jgi:DNA polymerase-3 subunit delta'
MTDIKQITWLKELTQAWNDRVERGRMPHAVLLTGPAGVGKRAAASWIAARHLGVAMPAELPVYPTELLEDADLHWISPAEDKESIGIDQVRELVAEFSMTSYGGGGKVAIIEPANAMTTSAANSLLKTLEEPSGDALLILVADRTARLPATIFSRCQRIDIALPAEADGLAWLDQLQPGAAWAEALRLAGNAPLAAIAALDQLDTHATMTRDFADVAHGAAAALEVAARWERLDTAFVLDWLARQVQQAIFVASSARQHGTPPSIDESVLKRMDRRNLFCYLDIINRLRGQTSGSYNVQLTLESLLINWAEGLANCSQNPYQVSIRQLAER